MFVKLIEYAITIDNIEFVDPNFFFWLVLPIPIRLIQLDRSFVYLSTLLCVRVRFFFVFQTESFPLIVVYVGIQKTKKWQPFSIENGLDRDTTAILNPIYENKQTLVRIQFN